MAADRFHVEDLPDQNRYVLIDNDATDPADRIIGEEQHADVGGDRVLVHTFVSDDYQGQGLASFLVRQVLDELVASGTRIVPVCPYVTAWLPKHPEYQHHVVRPRREHLQAAKERFS